MLEEGVLKRGASNRKAMVERFCGVSGVIPSGKRVHNYGKSPFFMGKS